MRSLQEFVEHVIDKLDQSKPVKYLADTITPRHYTSIEFNDEFGDYETVMKELQADTPADNIETELMAIVAEECGELTQWACKVIRFGIDDKKKQGLAEEAGDVALMIDLLIQYGYITQEQLNARKTVKRAKLKKYSGLITTDTDTE